MQFVICGDRLYKRSTNNILLRCLDEREAKEMIIQVHEGVCGPHMNGHRLAKKRLRLGYYSCTMERDCIHFVQRCHKCQVHANLIHAPPTELHNQTTPWPFAVYCLDLIGRLTRRQPIGHEYILVAIDSFTKWVEAASYTTITAAHVIIFLKKQLHIHKLRNVNAMFLLSEL